MTRLIPVVISFLLAVPAIAAPPTETLVLANGVELTVQESAYNRRLPHSYYDQAMDSIAQLYPEHDVLVGRRFGTLSRTEYSLLCYTHSDESATVDISGMFVMGKAAWHFSSRVPVSRFTESLILILEAISKPPSSTATEPGA